MVTLTDIPTYGTHRKHRRRLAAAALLCAATVLTGCGDERPATSAAPAPAPASDPASPSASAAASASPPASPGASPYVEPGVVDGAPHNRENNAYRRPGEMSESGRTDANTEVARMKPVLKRLWKAEKWDPESVRAELTGKLGYEDEVGGEGEGSLRVQEMYSDYGDDNEYVTPEGAMIGLSVGEDSCVTAYVDKSGYGAEANGRFPETGCIRPPTGH
ncbi:hypothetical protein [Streptomyces sp. KL118A]|uniref:hypothetical protein n=1 Tax=Streptomyces sp. KL118A TaxID=3045153 RepID=UPI00278C547E|nr:hypothetical protein [Streptomyces sp. KL118A]